MNLEDITLEEDNKSFIMFGCWNNLNVKKGKPISCLEKVMEKMSEHLISNPEIKHIVVAGDNYYPDKRKTPKDEEAKEEAKDLKQKIIYTEKLKEGFRMLSSHRNENVKIDMIFGNHDFETNGKKKNIYVEEIQDGKEEKDCIITKEELNIASELNIDMKLYDVQQLNPETVLILFDTSIYSGDVDSYTLQCYKIAKQNLEPASEEDIQIDRLDEEDPIPISTEEQIQQLQKEQQHKIIEKISNLITDKHAIQNVIMVGHHPIDGLRKKVKDGKVKIKRIDDITKHIQPFLRSIYSQFQDIPKYTYLCADYHSYQKGIINIEIPSSTASGHEYMTIMQYIVGTGGTELDDELDIEKEKIPSENRDPPKDDTPHPEYIIKENKKTCGFLECRVDGPSVNFTFVDATPAEAASEHVGGKSRKRRRKPRVATYKRRWPYHQKTKKQRRKTRKCKSNPKYK